MDTCQDKSESQDISLVIEAHRISKFGFGY
jgi:hypothetical protein